MTQVSSRERFKRGAAPARLAWSWFLLTASLGLASLLLFVRNSGTPVPASWGVMDGVRDRATDWFNAIQQSLISPLTMGALGTLILRRHPGHRIGRLLIALGCVSALAQLTQEWAVYGYYTARDEPAGVGLAAWVTNWIWIVLFTLLLLTAALFPDGRFPSRRWGWLIGVPLSLFALPLLIGAMAETSMSSAFQISNPFVAAFPQAAYAVLFGLGVVFMPVTAIAVLISAVIRFRASRARERQQMKWLLAGVALMAAFTLAGLGLYFGLGLAIGATLVNGAVLGPALGVGVALLRHHLYDIEVIIRRTLVYSTLSGLLALTYFGLVIVLQAAATALPAPAAPYGGAAQVGGARSEWGTVASTLAVAALFAPLRGRVQAFIDRRFYRQKYDAARVLSAFAAAARDETDLNALTGRLTGVVRETMEPEGLSVWLSQTAHDRSRTTDDDQPSVVHRLSSPAGERL